MIVAEADGYVTYCNNKTESERLMQHILSMCSEKSYYFVMIIR